MQCIVFCDTSQFILQLITQQDVYLLICLTISPSFSVIHTSSDKLLQCSDNMRYSAPTPESSDGFGHKWTKDQRLTSHNTHVISIPEVPWRLVV